MALRRVSHLPGLTLLCWLLLIPPTSAQEADCSSMFPDVPWVLVSETPTLAVHSAGLATAIVERFEADAARVAGWLEDDLGVVRRTDLCLFGPEVALNGTGIVPFGQRVHSAAFGPESVVVISASDIKQVQSAISYGLAYTALWETAEAGGLAGYPQPLADAVGQWYMARATGDLEAHHVVMLRSNFLQDPSGARPSADWTAGGPQTPLFAWNPEFAESPVGDMVDFAVAEHGPDVLLEPSRDTWAALESEYKAALTEELFGDVGGSFGWPWGLAIVMVILLLALVLSGYERRRKRKERERRPVADAPVEGLFEG
jgi:hypothetical protein